MGCVLSPLSKSSSPQRPDHSTANLNPFTPKPQDYVRLEQSKQKYIASYGAIAMEDSHGMVLLFMSSAGKVVLSFRDGRTGAIFAREFTDLELQEEKSSTCPSTTWNAYLKSIASDLLRRNAKVTLVGNRVDVGVVISGKEETASHPITIRLEACATATDPGFRFDNHRFFLEPMILMTQKRRRDPTYRDREMRCLKVISDGIINRKIRDDYWERQKSLESTLQPLREECAIRSQSTAQLRSEVIKLERRWSKRLYKRDSERPLDAVYRVGGARHFNHLPESDEHYPAEPQGIEEHFKAIAVHSHGWQNESSLPDKLSHRMLHTLTRLGEWDFNVFEMEHVSGGNALVFTTYALLCRLDLITKLKLNDAVVRNFLCALQAGYHPNPYHNATHAADVTQITYYIICHAGLVGKCNLSNTTLLAAIIAAAAHDFDHPGFNNSYHTRTQAYLATRYNDRSVLENHHCASMFELMRHPRYNILAPLSEEQFREVRETIVEMILATDMGNHGRIVNDFRQRLTEVHDWSQREDMRLALSMALKMADTSNTARPRHLYLEWAKNIANEFYNQGDYEERLKLTISPFMDRKKAGVEFPKGQISFITFVVLPMTEALVELLPALEFAIGLCKGNREYWQSCGST